MARKAAKEKEGMGARVERLRKERGWTQDELAPKVFMKRESLKNKELGLRPFALDEACELSKIFHVTLDYLVNGVNTKNVSVHEDMGLSDEAIGTIQEFYTREYNSMQSVNKAFASYSFLKAIALYMDHTVEKKGLYVSEIVRQKGSFEECMMSQEFTERVLEQNVMNILREAKTGDRTSSYYSALEDFEPYQEQKLAESSDFDKE